MKKGLLFLFIAQIVGFNAMNSQTTPPEKPATDACPTWNKKQISSKTEYFRYLSKSNKTKDQRGFNAPRYYNYNAVKTTATDTSAKNNQNTYASEKTSTEQVKTPVPTEVQHTKTVPIKKSTIDTTIAVAISTEPHKAATSAVAEPTATQANASSSQNEDKELKKDNRKQKIVQRKHWLKKIHLRKKRATSCPDF